MLVLINEACATDYHGIVIYGSFFSRESFHLLYALEDDVRERINWIFALPTTDQSFNRELVEMAENETPWEEIFRTLAPVHGGRARQIERPDSLTDKQRNQLLFGKTTAELLEQVSGFPAIIVDCEIWNEGFPLNVPNNRYIVQTKRSLEKLLNRSQNGVLEVP